MQALAMNGLMVLKGEVMPKEYRSNHSIVLEKEPNGSFFSF
jgi:hypothetical protein